MYLNLKCPSLASLTITQGPSTVAFTTASNIGLRGASPTAIKAILHCNLNGTTAAVCTNSFEGLENVAVPTDGLSSSDVLNYQAQLDDYKVPEVNTLFGDAMPPMGPIVVTAGAEKLNGKAPNSSASVTTNPAGGGVNTDYSKTANGKYVAHFIPIRD